MTDEDKKTVFRWLKEKSVADWLESAPEDTWKEWVETSLDALNKGTENLILFGPEVIFIMEYCKIFHPKAILEILVEFYNIELNNINNINNGTEETGTDTTST